LLVAFRKERAVHETQRLDLAGLLAERRRIREQLAVLEQRRQGLEARLAEIDRVTQAVQDG
jgi:chaperonin cofactor prefoldin